MFGKNHAIASRSHKCRSSRLRADDFMIKPFQPFLTYFFGELAFPHHDHFPAHRFKFGMLSDISFVVAQQFRTPEFHIRFRHARGFRAVFMHMPEAAIDEHHRAVFRQHHVGMSRIPLVVFAESQTFRKKKTAYHHFNGCVFASDMRHDVASRATLVFLFFCGFPRFSGLLNVFLRYHSTPLWQDPAKYGKSEKHPDKTQCKCDTDQRALRSRMAYAGTCNAAIININESTLFRQLTKDGS